MTDDEARDFRLLDAEVESSLPSFLRGIGLLHCEVCGEERPAEGPLARVSIRNPLDPINLRGPLACFRCRVLMAEGDWGALDDLAARWDERKETK